MLALWLPLPIVETIRFQTKHLFSNFNFSGHKWEPGMDKKYLEKVREMTQSSKENSSDKLTAYSLFH